MSCKVIYFLCLILISNRVHSQQNDSFEDPISGILFLDSIVVSAGKIMPDEFIDFVMHDESLYAAFKNLRSMSHYFHTEAEIKRGKKGKLLIHQSTMQQINQDNCREMEIISMDNSSRWRKNNGSHLYYTLELIDRLFWTHGRVCTTLQNEKSENSAHSRIEALKKLIFNPGIPADIPIVGKRLAIFSEKNIKYYQYHLSVDTTIPDDPYHFRVFLKPTEKLGKSKKMIIKNLETWFDSNNFQVLRRKYDLVFHHLAAQCDVSLDIKVDRSGDRYYPVFIQYRGKWNIPGKKREQALFTIKINAI